MVTKAKMSPAALVDQVMRDISHGKDENAGQGSPTADVYASGSVAHSTPCCRIMRHSAVPE